MKRNPQEQKEWEEHIQGKVLEEIKADLIAEGAYTEFVEPISGYGIETCEG